MKSVGYQTSNMGNWKCSERRNQLACSWLEKVLTKPKFKNYIRSL